MSLGSEFLEARKILLARRSHYEAARRDFCWPRVDRLNWALDYFDVISANNTEVALFIVDEDGSERKRNFIELALRSNQVANCLRTIDCRRGDHILLMLGNQAALWELLLAAMKLGAVVIPAAPVLTAEDLRDRLYRGNVRHVIAAVDQTPKFDSLAGRYTRTIVDGPVAGWNCLDSAAAHSERFVPDGETRATDALLLLSRRERPQDLN